MNIQIETTPIEQLSQIIPNEIPNPFVIFLDTEKETIDHLIYTTYLTKCYELILEKDQNNSTLPLILIPKKPINPTYSKVGIGGTFDILHCGHYSLFQSGLFSSQLFYVGLTGEELLKNKKCKDQIKSFEQRKQQIIQFFNEIGKHTTMVPYVNEEINVPEGAAGTDKEMKAVVVSKETLKGIDMINGIRNKNGLQPIDGIVIELINSSSGNKVSSSDLREKSSN